MAIIFNPNVCACSSTATSTVQPCFSNDDCCLTLCNVLTGADVLPCAASGSIDMTGYITIPSCCDVTTMTLSTPFISDNLTNVTFTYVSGVFTITFDTNWSDGLDYKTGNLVYQVECGLLKVQAEVVIPFDQIVENPDCEFGYDPCTGLCIPATPEISIETLPTNEITIT